MRTCGKKGRTAEERAFEALVLACRAILEARVVCPEDLEREVCLAEDALKLVEFAREKRAKTVIYRKGYWPSRADAQTGEAQTWRCRRCEGMGLRDESQIIAPKKEEEAKG